MIACVVTIGVIGALGGDVQSEWCMGSLSGRGEVCDELRNRMVDV